MSTTATEIRNNNGIDPAALEQLAKRASCGGACDPQASFRVSTTWRGGAKSESRVTGYDLHGKTIAKNFVIPVDEPKELTGTGAGPNPQEVLMAAVNACMVFGYVAVATLQGVTIESLSIESQGDLDLRGVLALDPKVKPGYESLHYTIRVKGDGTPEQFKAIHEAVIATSPNRWTIAEPVKVTGELIVE